MAAATPCGLVHSSPSRELTRFGAGGAASAAAVDSYGSPLAFTGPAMIMIATSVTTTVSSRPLTRGD